MNIPKNSINVGNVAFSGHKKKLDKTGYELQQFYYIYDPEKYNCDVEVYNVMRDDKGNINVLNPDEPQGVIPMDGFNAEADMSEFPELDSNIGFAYRFKLTDKDTNEVSYAFDNGSVIGIFDTKRTDNKYNVVLNNRAIINKNGPMQLIMPDEYYPGIENVEGQPTLNEGLRAKALAAVRTHANKLGGNFYGIIARLPELEKEGVKRIVGTPYTKDTISSHLYWTENAYQVAPALGTEEDFKTMQEELFKHDINWIADAALVNEGFGGIHMSEFLRKGQDSTSKSMFRAEEKVSLGIIPDKCDYTRMKIVNAPFKINDDGEYSSVNDDYNPMKPTYIQFYDDRLASDEQKASKDIINTYDNKNTDNVYDITKHDDAVYPYPIEVSPVELERNVKRMAQDKGRINLADVDTIKQIADFSNFNVVTKSAAAGLEVWDGNVDIAKLNFYRCDKDDVRFSKLYPEDRQEAIEDFDRGALAVRDYALNSGKYWTKLTADTLMSYVSNSIGGYASSADEYMSILSKLVDAGQLPKSVLENIDVEIIENVIDDNYHLYSLDDADMRADMNPEGYGNDYNVNDYILRKSMDCPLETLPFATNLLGVITSPYIAKKANTEDELGVSRYDVSKAGNPNLPAKYSKVYNQAEELYKNQIVPVISDIISGIEGVKDEDGMVTDYGKYVITEIAPELTKYLLVRALNPNADIKISSNGKIDFSSVDESEMTIQSLGIPFNGKSAEEEAQIVVDLLKQGMNSIPKAELNQLQENMKRRFMNRGLNDFKIAELIIDKTEAGQGWRIDAAKDIASIDAVRSDADSMTKAWNNVVDFWRRYNETVLKENPHAYTTAEITDLYDLFKDEAKTIFTSDADAERKFLEATGITAVANYNYFFSLLPDMFSNYGFEVGDESWRAMKGENFELRDKLDTGWSGTNPGFLFQSPEDGVVNSYTFVGNHDKPRVAHCLALDMGLFNSDFSSAEHKSKAAKCLMKSEKSINFDKVNPMAIAMGTRLNTAFSDIVSDKETLQNINKAVSELASGQFKGKSFDATAFGTRPFEVAIRTVLDEVEYNGGTIENREDVEAKVLESILAPAYDRFYSIYKLLMVLPGSPTDFAGDKVGASGYETKAKNYHQQNRNVIHWEWLSDNADNKYKFVKQFYDRMNAISNLRSKKELSALNDGATVTLPLGEEGAGSFDQKIQSILRYNDKGSVVLTLHDLSGASTPLEKKMQRKETNKPDEKTGKYNKIMLCHADASAKQGLKHGLQVGTKFKNERAGDNSTYEIALTTSKGEKYYYLKRRDAQGREIPVTIKPEDLNTLILYKVS